jgi:hypothetical protein
MTVRHARGTQLEREYGIGVVRQYLEPVPEEACTHALVFRVTVHEREEADKMLHEQFVPAMSQAPSVTANEPFHPTPVRRGTEPVARPAWRTAPAIASRSRPARY